MSVWDEEKFKEDAKRLLLQEAAKAKQTPAYNYDEGRDTRATKPTAPQRTTMPDAYQGQQARVAPPPPAIQAVGTRTNFGENREPAGPARPPSTQTNDQTIPLSALQSAPPLEKGTKIGDRLYFSEDRTYLTRTPTSTPARVSVTGEIVPAQLGDRAVTLTSDIYNQMPKKAYLFPTVKFGDALFMDTDENGWPVISNRSTNTAKPLMNDKGQAIVYSTMVMKQITGQEPPTPQLDPSVQMGRPLYYDPVRNLYTTAPTQFPVGLNKGQIDMMGGGQPVTYSPEIGALLSGEISNAEPTMGDLKPGDKLYYDYKTNQFTNKASPTAAPLYTTVVNQAVFLSGANINADIKLTTKPNGNQAVYDDTTRNIVGSMVSVTPIRAEWPEPPTSTLGPAKRVPTERTYTPWEKAIGVPDAQTYYTKETPSGTVSLANPTGKWTLPNWIRSVINLGSQVLTGSPVWNPGVPAVVQLPFKDTPLQAITESAQIPEQVVGYVIGAGTRSAPIILPPTIAREKVQSKTRDEVLTEINKVDPLWMSKARELTKTGVLTALNVLEKITSGVVEILFTGLGAPRLLATAADNYNKMRSGENVSAWSIVTNPDAFYAKYLGGTQLAQTMLAAQTFVDGFAKTSWESMHNTITEKTSSDLLAQDPNFINDATQFGVDTARKLAGERSKVLYDQAFRAADVNDEQTAKSYIQQAIHQERLSMDFMDPYFTVSFLKYPEKEQAFMRALSDVIYQTKRPLSRQEIIDLQNNFVDAGTEFAWQMAFDLANLSIIQKPIELTAKLLFGTLGKVGKGIFTGVALGGKAVQKSEVVMSVAEKLHMDRFLASINFDAIFKPAVRSAAAKHFQAIFNPVDILARQSVGFVGDKNSLVTKIGKLSDVVREYRAAKLAGEAPDLMKTMKEAGMPMAVSQRMAERLVLAADVIDPEKWATQAENVFNYLVEETARDMMTGSRKATLTKRLQEIGEITPEVLKKLTDAKVANGMEIKAAEKAALEELAEKKIKNMLRTEAASHITAEQFAGKFAERFQRNFIQQNSAWNGSEIMKGTLAGWYGNLNPNARRALDLVAQSTNAVSRLWVTATLARRPAWVVFNTLDNALRFTLASVSDPVGTFKYLFTDYKKVLESVGELPAELGMSLAREGLGERANVSWRTVERPYLAVPLVSMPEHYIHNLIQGHQSGTFFVKNLLQSWPQAVSDMNQAIEFSFRLRLFHAQYMNNLRILEKEILPRTLESLAGKLRASGVAEEDIIRYQDMAKDLWHMSGNDADRLNVLSDLRQLSRGADTVSLWIPDVVARSEIAMSIEDRDLFISAIKQQFDSFVKERLSSKKLLTGEDVETFFNGVLKSFSDEIERQLDPNGPVATVRSWQEHMVSEEDTLINSMKAVGMNDKAAEILIKGKIGLRETWNPSLRKTFKNAFGKGDGISTTGKTIDQAYDELYKEWIKRSADIAGPEEMGLDEKMVAYQAALKRAEARRAEVLPVSPARKLYGEKQSKVMKEVYAATDIPQESVAPAEFVLKKKAYAQTRLWNEMQDRLTDGFLVHIFPGFTTYDGGPERDAAAQLWEALAAESYNVGSDYGNSLLEAVRTGGTVPEMTPRTFFNLHGWSFDYDDTGRIIGGRMTLPNGTQHTLTKYELTEFSDWFGVKSLADMDGAITAEKLADTKVGQAAMRFENMKSLGDLRKVSPRVEAAVKKIEDLLRVDPASAEIGTAQREAAVAIAGEFSHLSGDFIVTAKTAGQDSDIVLVRTVNKWLDLSGDSAYTRLHDILPEQVYEALAERYRIRNAYNIPEYTSDFRDEMLTVLQEQYGMNVKQSEQVMSVYEAAASVWGKRYGKNPQDFWHEVFYGFYRKGEMTDIYGATSFERGKAIVTAFGKAKLNTALHEFFHALRGNPLDARAVAWLPVEDIKILDDWARPLAVEKLKAIGKPYTAEEVTTEMMEIQARGWEQHFTTGIAPTMGLTKVFEDIKAWMSKFYGKLKGYFDFGEIPDEVKAVYNRMLDDRWVVETGKMTSDQEMNLTKYAAVLKGKAVSDWNEAISALPPMEAAFMSSLVGDLQRVGYSAEEVMLMGDARTMMDRLREAIERLEQEGGDVPASLKQTITAPAPVWYSQLQRTVENIPQEKMTVAQLRAQVAKGGVKADERLWTGFDEWLDGMKDTDRITKSDVLDFLKRNEVQLEEVVLGEDVSWEKRWEQAENVAQYRSTTLAGGNNYRELLFKWEDPSNSAYKHVWKEKAQIRELLDENMFQFRETESRIAKQLEVYFEDAGTLTKNDPDAIANQITKNPDAYADPEVLQAIDPRDLQDARRLNQENIDLKERVAAWNSQPKKEITSYSAPHFGSESKNLLAHVRFDDRVDADGKRVLFIEEVQSDWHQAGRERGYATTTELPDGYRVEPPSTDRGIRVEVGEDGITRYYPDKQDKLYFTVEGSGDRWVFYRENINPDIQMHHKSIPYKSEQEAVDAIYKGYANPPDKYYRVFDPDGNIVSAGTDEGVAVMSAVRKLNDGKVAAAPFSNEAWADLLMKRMIRWASENGYDRVAFPTGPIAAEIEGHELIKQVDQVSYVEEYGRLLAYKDGALVKSEENVAPEKLKEYIGYDAAKQLLESPKDADGAYNLVTKDIQFGGEKMRWFYDRNLVNRTNKYLKKWGAEVSSTNIQTKFADTSVEVWNEQGKWHIQYLKPGETDDWVHESFATEAEARQARRRVKGEIESYKTEQVHSFDITPQMRISVLQGQPLFMQIKRSPELTEFWKAYIAVPRYQKESLSSILRDIFGDSVDLSDPVDMLTNMEKMVDQLNEQGLPLDAKVIDALRKEAESALQYMDASVLRKDPRMPPPIPEWILGENIQTWIASNRLNEARLKSGTRLIEDWKKAAKDALDGKVWWTKEQPENVQKAFTEWGGEASAAKAEAIGGAAWGNETMEGAVPFTNRWMLDYTDYSNFDSFMKNIVPFWMFPSRSMPLWAQTFTQHPEIVAAYFKYLQYSRRTALQMGAVNSAGEQLPSLVGYIPIVGTDVWYNPTAPASFRFMFPLNNGYYDQDQEDQTITENFLSTILNYSSMSGMYLSPILTASMSRLIGQSSNMRTPLMYEAIKTAIPIPLEMIPPWVERSLMGKMRRMTTSLPDMWNPEVSWKDYLIERLVLQDYLSKMQAAGKNGDTQKWVLANEATEILSNPKREQDQRWIAYRDALEAGDYWKRLGGFFTGFYVKEFSPAYAELLKIRDDVNNLRASINNEAAAQIFDLLPDAEDRYAQYNERRYNTPEGWIWNDYVKIRWVTDEDTGAVVTGQERRDRIAEMFTFDQKVRDFQQARTAIYDDYNTRLKAIPTGAPSGVKYEVYKWLSNQLNSLEAKTDEGVIRDWTVGNKPTSMLEEHFTNEWWKLVNATRPDWDEANGQTYTDWQEKVARWEKDLPNVANALMPAFIKRMELYQPNLQFGQILENIPANMQKQTNAKGYESWKLGKDTVYDALDDAWTEMYAADWWNIFDASGNLTNSEKELRKREFFEKHPNPPTEAELYQYIRKVYGDTFSQSDVWLAMVGRDTLEMQQRLDYNKTDYQKLGNDVWDWLNMATTSGRSTDLRRAYEALGGDPGDIDVWYKVQAPDGFADPEDFMKFHDLLQQAIQQAGITAPTDAKLSANVPGEKAKAEFEAIARKQFGDKVIDGANAYSAMSASDQKAFRKANPSLFASYKAYWDAKDKWDTAHPEIAALTAGSTSSSSGGGGGYYSGGGGGSGGSSSSTKSTFMGQGYRSTLNARNLLGATKLGSGGYAGVPKWPTTLNEMVSPMLVDEVNQALEKGIPLSDAAITYMKQIADKYPEYKNPIYATLGEVGR